MVAQAVTPKPTVPPKPKKEPQTPVQRITETLKRAVMQGKISKDELEIVANLAGALKTFMAS